MSDIGIPDAVLASVMKEWGFGDGEVPPEPAQDGQDVPPAPSGDAPDGLDHDPLAEPLAPPEPTPTDPAGQVGDGEEAPPPSPPGGPLWQEEPPVPADPAAAAAQVTLPDGRTLDTAALAALADLDQAIRAGRTPWQAPTQPPPPSPTVPPERPTPDLPPPPRFTEEDMDDPRAVAAVTLWLAQKQQADLAAVRAQLEQTSATLSEQRHADAAGVTSSVMSLYKQRYNLPDDVMERIVATAAPISAPLFQMYMNGTDPRTGAAVVPDAAKAVETVLDMAYWNTPEARRFEVDRQTAHRAKVAERKNKLGGIGGSSGSAPRQPKPLDPSDRDAVHRAAIEEMAAAMGVSPNE